MSEHSHRFVKEYQGLVGFGLNRETDEATITYYLQKFSDDQLMALIRGRMSQEDLETLFALINRLMKNYLNEEEYHTFFLKDPQV